MAMTLITTNVEAGDSTSVFTSGIDSTYKLYIFNWISVGPASDANAFKVNFSTDGGSNYNMTKTTVSVMVYHGEGGGANFEINSDLAQATGGQALATGQGNASDESTSGTLWLFNPSNTTYVKHFQAWGNNYYHGNELYNRVSAGYINSTDDIDAVEFKMDSGAFDGTISMYGVDTS